MYNSILNLVLMKVGVVTLFPAQHSSGYCSYQVLGPLPFRSIPRHTAQIKTVQSYTAWELDT